MITLSFSDFYRVQWTDEGYELYIVRDLAGAVMYVGISRDSVWTRWFGGIISHMEPIADGSLRGISDVGEAIARRFPESWDWSIELWTHEDCVEALLNQGCPTLYNRDVRNLGIHHFEVYFIEELSPFYNVMHAGGRSQDPLLRKQLNEAYDRIFNKHKDGN